MVWIKRLALALVVYVGIVIAFETLIGVFQPQSEETMVVSNAATGDAALNRVLTRIESDGQLYAAVNHWPRAWYRKVLENPEVRIAIGDEVAAYRAVGVSDPAEIDRLQAARPAPIVFKILTGFPPRKFVRFERVDA